MSLQTLIPSLGSLILTVLFAFSVHLQVQAQESLVAGCGEDYQATGSVSWSVGQLFFLYSEDTLNSQIQGVQQPYEIQFFPGIDHPQPVKPFFSLYPNPVTYQCTLSVEGVTLAGLCFEVHDLNGNRLIRQQLVDQQQTVPVEELPPGTYLVTLWQQSLILQQGKLIKR